MHGDGASSNKDDWTALCAEAAVGGLAALAAVPDGELVRDPALRRLLSAVADEAAAAAKGAGHCAAGRPARSAAIRCRRHPDHRHPWQRALRQRRKTGAQAVLGPILAAARRAGTPAPKLTVIAAVLRRLESDV
jgi:ketopantoate reductase